MKFLFAEWNQLSLIIQENSGVAGAERDHVWTEVWIYLNSATLNSKISPNCCSISNSKSNLHQRSYQGDADQRFRIWFGNSQHWKRQSYTNNPLPNATNNLLLLGSFGKRTPVFFFLYYLANCLWSLFKLWTDDVLMETGKLNTKSLWARSIYLGKKPRIIPNLMLITMKREAKYLLFTAIIYRKFDSTAPNPKPIVQEPLTTNTLLEHTGVDSHALKIPHQSLKAGKLRAWGCNWRLTTGSVGWKMFNNLLQMVLGRMWSWLPLVPGRIPRKARNTARGDPIQKKFSTWGRDFILGE